MTFSFSRFSDYDLYVNTHDPEYTVPRPSKRDIIGGKFDRILIGGMDRKEEPTRSAGYSDDMNPAQGIYRIRNEMDFNYSRIENDTFVGYDEYDGTSGTDDEVDSEFGRMTTLADVYSYERDISMEFCQDINNSELKDG